MPCTGDGRPARGRPEAPAATLSDVAVAVAGRPVLDGASLELRPRSVLVLLGENGAGKTTLMRTLCGRTSPHRGRVAVGGGDPRTDVRARGAVGFVPQSIALYPALTVRENLVAFRSLARRGRLPPRVVDDVLRDVRLDHVADRRVGELSGGHQRRANVGAALVGEPDVLLFDEPTVGLDAAAKSVLVDVVRAVARRGAAALVTTHDFDVADALADRVGFLVGGRIVAEGALRELSAKAFEGRRVLTFLAERDADPGEAAGLEAAGLRLSPTVGTWRSPPRGASPEAVRLAMHAADPSRLGTRRLEVAEPGLGDLYRFHVAKEHGVD